MLRFSLAAAGFEFTETNCGAEAMRILGDRPPDAVVLDLSLADGMGPEILKRLAGGNFDGNKIPAWVVISTMDVAEAQDVAGRICNYKNLGDRFLAKPFDPWELVHKLETQLKLAEIQC